MKVPPYSTLKEVLELIELPDDVDYDRINSYQILKHSDVYVVPLKENKPCIHLNHADESTLMHLKGVGPSIAQRIIQYRNEVGLFSSIEEIMNVKGIGQKTFDKMKDDLCL